jgi:hypothetical protein
VSVSAMKLPPYGPKWPDASGWEYSNMVICFQGARPPRRAAG